MFNTRKEAKENGEKFYFSAKECQKGHLDKRYVSNNHCLSCKKDFESSAVQIEKSIIRGRNYYHANKEVAKKRSKIWRDANKDYFKNYRIINKGKVNWQLRKRYIAEIVATPIWVDEEKLATFYANCPKGMTVDHIVPLQGEDVCGLNVHYNLQYLTRSANSAKCNRY